MPDEFEMLSDSALAELTPHPRGYTKSSAPAVEEFEVMDEKQIDGLIDRQLSESIFDVLPAEYNFDVLPDPDRPHRKALITNKPVIFIDGEGANVGERTVTFRKHLLHRWVQKQNYALLGAVLESGEYRCIVGENNTEQLSTKQCLEFILSLPGSHIIVGFALNYDVEMWLRGISHISTSDKP